MINEWKMSEVLEAIKANKSGGREVVYAGVAGSVQKSAGESSNVKTWMMSEEVRDRDNEIMKLSGARFENYNKNPVVCWMHQTRKPIGSDQDYNPDNVIGKGKAYISGGKFMNDIEFEPKEINPLAWKISQKVEFGSLTAGSIGFIPYDGHWGEKSKGEAPDVLYITDWELTEYSVVVIPALPSSLRTGKQHEDENVSYDTQADKKQIGATALTTDVARARLFITTNSFTNE